MSKPELTDLLKKYNDGKCDADERALVESWYAQFELQDVTELTAMQLNEIEASLPTAVEAPIHISLWTKIAIAAAIALIESDGNQ